MALIYCYRWSCYSWRETTKSQPTFFSYYILMWKWCWKRAEDIETNNETEIVLFYKKKWFRSRFDSVQWSFSCFTGHIYFSHHNLDGMQLSSAQQTRRPRTIWCHSKSNRSWLFPFGEQASVFFSLFTIAIIHPANISLFVLHIVCCFISFFHFFFLLSFHSFNEEHSGCDSLYAYK